MKKIDFTKIVAPVSFDGETKVYNIAKRLGNLMMFNSSVLLDIGFEDLARTIYYSGGEVEVPDEYAKHIQQIVFNSEFIATIKRSVIRMLE